MVRKSLAFVALLFLSAPGLAQDAEQSDRYEFWLAGQERQRAFVHGQFEERGYRSIAEAQIEGREVRRVLVTDPYHIMHLPGIEIEQHDDGSVTLQLQYVGWTSEHHPVDPAIWTQMAALESDVFAPPIFVSAPPRSGPPPPLPAVRHCWSAHLAAGWDRTTSWSGCGNQDRSELDYITLFVEAALATRPDCERSDDRLLSDFQNCFLAREALDDPELDEEFQRMRAAYSAANTSTELAEVRRLISATDPTLGDEDWLAIRDALQRKFAKDRVRTAQLQSLRRLLVGRSDVSQSDRAKIDLLIRNWASQEAAWSNNNRALFEALVFARRD